MRGEDSSIFHSPCLTASVIRSSQQKRKDQLLSTGRGVFQNRHLQSIAPLSDWGRGMFWWKKAACDAQGFHRLAVPVANTLTGAVRAGRDAWRFRDAHSGLIIHILHNWPTSTSESARLLAPSADPLQVFSLHSISYGYWRCAVTSRRCPANMVLKTACIVDTTEPLRRRFK